MFCFRCCTKTRMAYLSTASVITTTIFVMHIFKELESETVLELLNKINKTDQSGQNNVDKLNAMNYYSNHKEAVLKSYIKLLGGMVKSEDIVEIRNYFQVREKLINPLDYALTDNVQNVCDSNKPPFLLIICISEPKNLLKRMAIRNTWAQMTASKSRTAKFVFVVGKSYLQYDDDIEKEVETHGDIIRIDLFDSYKNLSMKVLMGLKWSSTFCQGVEFVMKVDDDCFVHVGNAITMLAKLTVPKHGIIVGNIDDRHKVQRTETKWVLSVEEFPFPKMPLYANGQTYVISGNIIRSLLYAGERMPYVFIEDGFVTGASSYTTYTEEEIMIKQLTYNLSYLKRYSLGFLWLALHQRLCNVFIVLGH